MTENLNVIRAAILTCALANVAFDGWTDETLARAAAEAGYAESMGPAVFPRGIPDLLAYFAADIDRQMLDAVPATALAAMRVRDRVAALVLARFDVLNGVAEAERLAIRYWSVPRRAGPGARLVWRTADAIWHAAGDTATDYNRHTKRGLLTGVLASATLVWLRDADSVPAFVARRIENVMQMGRLLGKIAPGSRTAKDDGAKTMRKDRGRRTAHAILALLALGAMALPPAPAHAALRDVWNRVFPPPDAGPKPEDTLVAPFADPHEQEEKKVDDLYADPGAEAMDLSQPNRGRADLAQWLTHTLADIFETDPVQFDKHVAQIATDMAPGAVAQYRTFMQSSNILRTLSDNHLALHGFVEEEPILLNAMALQGRYHWLYEVPMTLTFLPNGAKSYDQTGTSPVNQHVIVRLQLGRMPPGQGVDELEIESFDVRQNTQPTSPPPGNQ